MFINRLLAFLDVPCNIYSCLLCALYVCFLELLCSGVHVHVPNAVAKLRFWPQSVHVAQVAPAQKMMSHESSGYLVLSPHAACAKLYLQGDVRALADLEWQVACLRCSRLRVQHAHHTSCMKLGMYVRDVNTLAYWDKRRF